MNSTSVYVLLEYSDSFVLRTGSGPFVFTVYKRELRDRVLLCGRAEAYKSVMRDFGNALWPRSFVLPDDAKAKIEAFLQSCAVLKPAVPHHAWNKPNEVTSFDLTRDGVELQALQVPYGAYLFHKTFGLCVRLNTLSQEIPVQVVDRKFMSFAVDPDDVVFVDDRISLPPGDE
jgi:hypothetical protein